MKTEFKISSIVGIKTINERENTSFQWFDEIPSKSTFFGMFKSEKVSEGFGEIGYNTRYTDLDLIKRGYNVSGKKVFYRPYATVYLEHEYEVQKTFRSNEEMSAWVNYLKTENGGNFEIVNHK